MGAPGQAVLSGSRIAYATDAAPSTRDWAALEDADVADWTSGDDFILAFAVETESAKKCASTLQVQWRNVTDSGSFAALGATGELNYNGATDLVNNDPVYTGMKGCTPSGSQTWQDGEEIEGANDGVFSTGASSDYWSEYHIAIDGSSMLDGKQYEFRIWDVSEGVSAGTCLAQITTAAGATHYTIVPLPGAFPVAGQTVTLLKDSLVVPSPGAFPIAGAEADFKKGFKVSVLGGAFPVAGETVSFSRGYAIMPDPGAFPVVGSDMNPEYGHVLSALAGAFPVAGTDADFKKGRTIVPLAGSFPIAGDTVTFLLGYLISTDTGAYPVSGIAVELLRGYVFVPLPGAFPISGTEVNFNKGRRIVPSPGAFPVVGASVEFLRNYIMDVLSGAFPVAGAEAELNRGFEIVPSPGAFPIAGADVELTYTPSGGPYILVPLPGAFPIAGSTLNLRYDEAGLGDRIWQQWSGYEWGALHWNEDEWGGGL